MRLRLIQIPSVPSLGVYPTYRLAAAVQELVRRQFLNSKEGAITSQGARGTRRGGGEQAAQDVAKSALQLPAPPQPTVLTFTPSPTYTLGRRQDASTLPEASLARLRAPLTVPTKRSSESNDTAHADNDVYTFIPVIEQSLRGGLTTYHGPGQAVLWPIFDLKSPQNNHFTVRCYSRLLENTTASVLKSLFSVDAYTTADPGLWVRSPLENGSVAVDAWEERKIAALGVHLRRNISSLGVAVNLNTPVTRGVVSEQEGTAQPEKSPDEAINPWARFVPCGLDGKGVSCVADEGRLRLGHTPEAWNLEPGQFASRWAAVFAEKLGLEPEVDLLDRDAVSGLIDQASQSIALEDEEDLEIDPASVLAQKGRF